MLNYSFIQALHDSFLVKKNPELIEHERLSLTVQSILDYDDRMLKNMLYTM